ncbi:DNA repaire protein UVS6 [Biscogniauxia mediterranea]|nr:DNA repaire protein UVS6 [Biscogniauxia mediterranea]
MSKIDKLSIMGIRSFNHLTYESIDFNTPLTLIVGYNGSGKTTIIECLKYATTGELPPNSKGGAFIHDPKLCGEREVKATVMLRFRAPPNAVYTVTRSLQLTVKKSSRTQRTVDNTLTIKRMGEKTVSGGKCASLDVQVPEHLGVAPAILDAVIFCHQDESLWPMSEPSVLKKKFDEIFEAMKYTKAIENLKTMRKKQGEELGKLKIFEGQQKDRKEKADRSQKYMEQLEAEIEELREEYAQTNQKIIEAERNAQHLREQANSFLNIVNEAKMKRKELDFHQSNLDRSKSRMDSELSEPDDQLRETLAQYEEQVKRYNQELEESKSQYKQHSDELGQLRREMSTKLAEQGRFQSDQAKYERQLKNRVELVQQAAQVHSIRGFDGDLDNGKVQAFYDRIQKLLVDKKSELEHLQSDNAREVDSKTAAISELEGQKSRYIQTRVFAKQRIAACEKHIATLQKDLASVDVDEGAKALLDSEFKELDQKLQQSSQDLHNADFDQKLQNENGQLKRLESEHSMLVRELGEATRLLSDRAELELRKTELTEKRRRLETLVSTWSEKLSTIIGTSWEPTTIDREFQKALQDKTQAHDEASRKRDDHLQQLKQLQFALASAKGKAKKREEEIEQCKSAVLQALKGVDSDTPLGVESLPKEIERLEDNILNLEKDIFMFDQLKQYYLGCQKTLNKKNRCELCERPFADAGEKSRLAAKIRTVLEGFKKEELQSELAECEELVGQLRIVRPRGESYSRLLSENPESDKEIRELQEKEDNMVRILESLDEVVREKQEELHEVESMSKTVLNISQTQKDIDDAEAQVDRIMSQQQSSSSVRSTQEVSELQAQCSEQMQTVKSKIETLSKERQRARDIITTLELHRSELKHKISHAANQLEKKKGYQDQIQAHKDDLSNQREVIKQADKDLESVEPEISKARTIRDDAQRRGREKEKRIADERDALASSVRELKMVDGDIQDYLDRGGPANLIANEEAIQLLEETIQSVEKDMKDIAARSNKIQENLANSDRTKDNIAENLNYRQTLRDIEDLNHDIEKLEMRNASEDYERLEQDAKKYEIRRHQLNADRGTLVGTMKSKDDELKRLVTEWETDYHNAAQDYRKTHIEVEAKKAAIEDLGRYGSALNDAIMKYHALKMEEVNRIAGELWQSTYQGTDIDTILIKSDSETTNERKTYNYRVCMVKQDTEMDMRGRCSAGQKVLASIIIRLALAESFGVGCGLIALDEPTTNLDRDNIRSLAESLHEIIRARRSQRNFQLIVITHDEEFLRHMRCSDFCDVFYRVKRDQSQNSVISRESIASILG